MATILEHSLVVSSTKDNLYHTLGTVKIVTDMPGVGEQAFSVQVDAKQEAEIDSSVTQPESTHVYVWDEISNSPVFDMNSGYRWNRPSEWYATWVKFVLNVIYQATPGMNIDLPEMNKIELHWSQYAGCKTCSCSPGFLLESRGRFPVRTMNFNRIDLTISVTEITMQAAAKVTKSLDPVNHFGM